MKRRQHHRHRRVEIAPRALNTIEAAKYLGVSAAALRKWRRKDGGDDGVLGPDFYKVGRNIVLYRVKDLEKWLENPT